MLSNANYSKLKAALTRAKNSGDPVKVLAAVKEATAVFDRDGWPDGWATWSCAWDDAMSSLMRTDLFRF